MKTTTWEGGVVGTRVAVASEPGRNPSGLEVFTPVVSETAKTTVAGSNPALPNPPRLAGGMFEDFLHGVGFGPLDEYEYGYIPPALYPVKESDPRAAAVANYLAGRPLQDEAGAMVAAADDAGIDYRLIPVICVLESGCGAQACGFNAVGYASCQQDFDSYEGAWRVTARTLAGYGGNEIWKLGCWNRGCGNTGAAAGYVGKALAEMERMR